MDELQKELLDLIKEVCDLDDTDLADLSPEDPLIGPQSPLGLDSLDALEVVTAVQRKYGVRIDNQNTSMQVLQSLNTLEEFIMRERHQA